MEWRVKEMKAQVNVMCRLIEGSASNKSLLGKALVRVAELMDTDDIKGYLLTFKRQMAAYEVDKFRWPFIFALQLTRSAADRETARSAADTETARSAAIRETARSAAIRETAT